MDFISRKELIAQTYRRGNFYILLRIEQLIIMSVSIHYCCQSQYLHVFARTYLWNIGIWENDGNAGITDCDTSTFCSRSCCCFCRANPNVPGFIWQLYKHRFAANKPCPSYISTRTLKYSKSFQILQRVVNIRHLLPRSVRLSSRDKSSPLRSY